MSSAQDLDTLYSTVAPFTFSEWSQRNLNLPFESSIQLYNEYLKKWYIINDKTNLVNKDNIKQDYINLLKELTFFFGEEEKDLFLRDINFENDTEIIYSIPYFVQKLKEVALTLRKKRDYIKSSRKKFDSIGSVSSLESILYEYILKSHTKTSETTQISISSLGSVFPELSAVKDNFIVEIEEIYDQNTYAAVSPLSADILSVVPRVGDNPLFNVFANFLLEDPAVAPLSSYSNYTLNSLANIYNTIELNKKYLGNTVYGLTATKVSETPAATVFFDMGPGNNWFYWPSGEVFTDTDNIQNTYEPIALQDSSFTTASSTGGSSYLDSDLFFIETKTGIEGAWLRGMVSDSVSGTMVMTAQPDSIRSFIYPVPGYDLSTTYTYTGRKLDDEHLKTFNLLDPALKANIIKQYFNKPLEVRNIDPVFINNTSLIASKATAGFTSMQGDLVIKRPPGPYNLPETPIGVFADEALTESAFLYKLTSTELPISQNTTYIEWPIIATQETTYTDTLEITPDTCNSVSLGYINVSKNMIGAVAGETIDTADVIYKLSRKNGVPVEAAWLHGGSVRDLATFNSYSIPVYDIPATKCVDVPKGAIQSSLSFKCEADKKVSFVWCDIDTPADEVFKYTSHSPDCKYLQSTHEYLKNDSATYWDQCTCKTVHFSPIGHSSNSLTDYIGGADYLFADPQGVGKNFTLTSWRDTRNLNYKNSPQFAYFKKENTGPDTTIGWGPGRWQTGNGKEMILKTGRRYTYFRSSLKNINNAAVPALIGRYPYKKIISSVQGTITHDLILLIDISGSEFYSIEKIKTLSERIVNYINTGKGSQVGIVIFNQNTVVASYLTTDKQILNNTIELISVQTKGDNSNIDAGLKVAYKLLTNKIGLNVNQSSLVGICSNLNVSIQTPFSQIKTTNIPKENNQKTIILFSDGAETVNIGKAIGTATDIKSKNIKIISVDIGPNSSSNTYMEQFATSTFDYCNFEKALLQNDSDNQLDVFTSIIISRMFGDASMQPVWRKATVINSSPTASPDISDMVLKPGDYLSYNHQSTLSYSGTDSATASFIINIPLYGWNYETKINDGISLGAKPYWGKVYNKIDETNNFTKYSREMGGHIRFFEDYIPISHPEISDIQFTNNSYIEYRNNGCDVLEWKEDIKFNSTVSNKTWLKLNSCIQSANLRELFTSTSLDKIFEQTEEPSSIVLTTYRDYVPAYYCYYARNAFSAFQNLLLYNNPQTYSQIQTGIAIPATSPYLNLTNTHYASIASQYNINSLVTKEELGGYLLPTKIGVPYYLGRGYTNELDTVKIKNYSGEMVYLDPSVYTSNRGLSKVDQFSPFTTVNIDNTWIKESYNSEKKAGTIINSISYQKFVPYQSSYETYKHNIFGLSRQDDKFEFWAGPNNNVWNDEVVYPTNYKKETFNLNKRIESLLVTDKTLSIWQTDLDGNNYGVYKTTNNLTQKQIKQAAGELWMRDINNLIIRGPEALKEVYINYIEHSSHYNSLINNDIVNFTIVNNAAVIQTTYSISIDQIEFDRILNKIVVKSDTPAYINLYDSYYSGSWYIENSKKIYFNTFSVTTPSDTPVINYKIYEYDIRTSKLKVILTDNVECPYAIDTINTLPQFTYNKDTSTFNTTFIFKSPTIVPSGVLKGNDRFNLFSINVKNLNDNPYIINAQVAI